jgi:cytochrome P450
MLDWGKIPNDGLVRYQALFNAERLLITSPKALSEVLTTKSYEFVKPNHVVRGIGTILGNGVLVAEGEEHKFQRKHLMPAFAFRHVKDLYPVFWNKSREAALAMSEQIKKDAGTVQDLDVEKTSIAADQAILELQGWASRATLDIIGVAGMGQDFGAIANPEEKLYKTYNTIFKPSKQGQVLGLLGLFLPSWIVRNIPLKRNGDIERAALVIREVCRSLIQIKREKLEKKELTDVDILSVAMESGIFSDDQLVDQMMTFLAAGVCISLSHFSPGLFQWSL